MTSRQLRSVLPAKSRSGTLRMNRHINLDRMIWNIMCSYVQGVLRIALRIEALHLVIRFRPPRLLRTVPSGPWNLCHGAKREILVK